MKLNFKLTLAAVLTLLMMSGVQLISTQQVFAQEEVTATTTETASPSSETTQNLKERIEKIVSEKKEQIKEVVTELATQKRGFVGEVTRVAEDAMSIKTLKTTEIVSLDERTTFKEGSQEISTNDIEVGSWVVVMGLVNEQSFLPVRVLVSDETLRPLDHVIELGAITDIDNSGVILAPRSGESQIEFSFTKNTSLEDLNGEEIDLDDIEEDMQALVVAYQDEDEKVLKRVRVLTTVETE
jgi:hypothetical protein